MNIGINIGINIYIYIYIKVLDDGCARTEFVVGKSDMENATCPKKGVLGPNSWREKAT